MHPADERVVRSLEQRCAERRRELLSNLDRTAERVLSGRRALRRDPGRDPFGHAVPIDRDTDAAEERDTERPAELSHGLRDPAAAPARSAGADPMIRSFVSVKTGAVPRENATEPVTIIANPVVASICVKTMNPSGREREAGGHDRRWSEPLRELRCYLGADDERERPWERPEPGF